MSSGKNIYYIYSYLRENRSPYYIGKGKEGRAFTKGYKEVRPPQDKSKVKILKANLTEEEAFALERLYILMFGRKDLGTGILRNKTDGGDGSSGAIRSAETREKLRQANLGKKKPKEVGEKISKALTGRKLSEEMKSKLREGHKGRKCTEEHKRKVSEAKKGFKHTEEAKRLMGINQRKKAKPHKLTFADGRELIVDNIMEWCETNPYSTSPIYKVKNKGVPYRDIIKVELVE